MLPLPYSRASKIGPACAARDDRKTKCMVVPQIWISCCLSFFQVEILLECFYKIISLNVTPTLYLIAIIQKPTQFFNKKKKKPSQLFADLFTQEANNQQNVKLWSIIIYFFLHEEILNLRCLLQYQLFICYRKWLNSAIRSRWCRYFVSC